LQTVLDCMPIESNTPTKHEQTLHLRNNREKEMEREARNKPISS
jgi:hypothetical protein